MIRNQNLDYCASTSARWHKSTQTDKSKNVFVRLEPLSRNAVLSKFLMHTGLGTTNTPKQNQLLRRSCLK